MKKLLAVVGLVLLFASPALAAPRSITLDQADPHFGDAVTFSISGHDGDDWVNLRCFQGDLVFYHSQRVGETFHLGPSAAWSGGEAECVASLSKQTNHGLSAVADVAFHVGA